MRTNDIFTTTYSPGSDPLRSAAKLLTLLEGGEKSAAEIAEALEIKSRPFLTNRYLVPLMAKGLIRQTLPDKPKSRFQRYALA